MAQTGEFPWHAQSHIREPTYLDEKAAVRAADNVPSSIPQPKVDIVQPAKNVIPFPSTQTTKHQPNGRRVSIKTPAPAPAPVAKEHIYREGAMHVPVRTIPPWVRDAEESDLDDIEELPAALVAHHNHSPANQRPLLGGARQHRTTQPPADRKSRWMSFAKASAYPREDFDSRIVDEKWLEENDADYSKDWLEGRYNEDDAEDGDDVYRAFKRRRKVWYKRAQFTILRNPFIPLSFRLTVIAFALTALALGATIYHDTDKILQCVDQAPDARSAYCNSLIGDKSVNYYRDPSALMAIIVDVIAVMYSGYITYDEYFSKPLGLRPARHKVRLILLDLFFIVFQSANLSLSFLSLSVDEGACAVGDETTTSVRFDKVCNRQEALSSVLLVSLVAWLMTFSVSVLRLVERINAR